MAKAPPQPTSQYKAVMYALRCGDRSFAEYFARNQPARSRSVREYLEVLDGLGWVTLAGKTALGLATEQLTLEGTAEGNGSGRPRDRVEICAAALRTAGRNGLSVGSLVSIVGEAEGAKSYRDRNWRRPVMAELGNEYVDRGIFVREGDRLYLPEFAPQPIHD